MSSGKTGGFIGILENRIWDIYTSRHERANCGVIFRARLGMSSTGFPVKAPVQHIQHSYCTAMMWIREKATLKLLGTHRRLGNLAPQMLKPKNVVCDKDLDRAGERMEKRILGTIHKVSGTEEADVRWGTQIDIILLPYPVPQSLPLPQSTATPEPTPQARGFDLLPSVAEISNLTSATDGETELPRSRTLWQLHFVSRNRDSLPIREYFHLLRLEEWQSRGSLLIQSSASLRQSTNLSFPRRRRVQYLD